MTAKEIDMGEREREREREGALDRSTFSPSLLLSRPHEAEALHRCIFDIDKNG